MNLNLPIKTIKGVGDKKAETLAKLDILTLNDLVHYFPRDYERYNGIKAIIDIRPNEPSYIKGFIKTALFSKRVRNLIITTTTVEDDSGKIQVTWFNQPYLLKQFNVGDELLLKGKVTIKGGKKQLASPQLIKESDLIEAGHLMPIYPLTKKITNKELSKYIRNILSNMKNQLEEFYPETIVKKYNLMVYGEAVKQIHYPDHIDSLYLAKRRLVFDEFLFFHLGLRIIKGDAFVKKNQIKIDSLQLMNDLLSELPFELTNAQKKVLGEIVQDIKGEHVMNRLIQGDVGSGKTIIAALSLLAICENGYQGVLMAPTEVLAKQHYESFKAIFKGFNINIALLTGSTTKKNKEAIYKALEAGEIHIVIGTHALIQEKVHFKSLGMVITDEQHRFGVKQREALSDKGGYPHVLVMSATPIPRTLALIVYGDMSVSVIDELPKGRIPIKTHVVDTSYRERIYGFMLEEIQKGRQCYVLCPMVEDQEASDLMSVESYTEQLQGEFPETVNISGLHGKMKSTDKNAIMQDFAKNHIQILVSTTVVEVGVNVPNASIMVIENAERFGLAQLHQLRGRVGRGAYESHCILISDSKSQATKDRLMKLKETNDGFEIADYDLRTRGPGDSFGTKQHGLPNFRLGNIFADMDILKETFEVAKSITTKDPQMNLREHQGIKERINQFYKDCSDTMTL